MAGATTWKRSRAEHSAEKSLTPTAFAECGRPFTSNGRVVDGSRRVKCAGRKQGLGCMEPTFVPAGVEAQIEGALARFAVPAANRQRRPALVAAAVIG